MDRLKLILALLLFSFAKNNLLAKNNKAYSEKNNAIKENVYISINSNVALTGERLYFSLICVKNNNTYSDLSKIAYVELINDSKEVVKRQKLSLNDGKSQSFFFIPSDFKTGNYKIVGYTNWMLDSNDIELNAINISIINTYQPLQLKEKQFPNVSKDLTNNIIDEKTKLSFLNKKTYSKRELVKLSMDNLIKLNPSSNYSLKVYKKDSLTDFFNQSTGLKNEKIKLIKKTTEKPISEIRGEIITGKITSKQKNIDLKNIDLAVTITNKTSFIKIIQTNHLGHFGFSIENLSENSNLLIQILNDDYDKYDIELNTTDYLDYSSLQFESFNINASLNKSLEKRSISNQIENAYIESKKDSIKSVQEFREFLKLDNIYNLEDYTRFKSLKETLKEIIPHAYYKKIGKKNTIQISDNTKDYDSNSPTLIIIDGIYIQDADELFNYNFDNVKSIGVKRDGYLLGSKIFNGILWIETISGDYEPNNNFVVKKEILRPSPELVYFKPDYSQSSSSRIPDYRLQLLWIPRVKTDDKEIFFYTSDLEGDYEIVMEEITSTGLRKIYTDSFEVK